MEENKKTKKPVVLVIMDGWGEWEIEKGNAIAGAKLPTIDKLNRYYPKLLLQASGLSVGLPWGVQGNSEVGHQAMGTGQIIFQYLPSIDMSIQSGSFSQNPTLIEAFEASKGKALHLVGLVSNGGVHSHINHLMALLGSAKEAGVENVFVHAITDGRDTAPKSAKKYIGDLLKNMSDDGLGELASISGRYFAMDRNNNWDRIEKAYKTMTSGGDIKAEDALAQIDAQYGKQIQTDEYIEPFNLLDREGNPKGLIKDEDTVICFNFRKDRARQITKAFAMPEMEEIKAPRPKVNYYCFTEYEKDLPVKIIFPKQEITCRVGQVLSENKKKQLRIAETEKYAHVTYFFNGGAEKPFEGEERILVPSKDAPSYADVPEMSAFEVNEKLLKAIDEEKYDFILVNFANPDMVGHTGDLNAGIKAVEVTDKCLGDLIEKVLSKNGCLLVTADHGNVEEMINLNTYEKDTEHSANPVPAWLVDKEFCRADAKKYFFNPEVYGMIVDIPPTILDILGVPKPDQMSGISLLETFKKKI